MRLRSSTRRQFAPYVFLLPFVILFLTFLIYPLGRSLWLSFCSGTAPVRFSGLKNYSFLTHDPYFWLALANTAAYVLAFLVILIPTSLGLAILLNSKLVYCTNFFRFAFFSTHLVGQVFVAVVFGQLLNSHHGLLPALPWLTNPVLARVSVLLAWLWLSIGYAMIYFLAALQAVDSHLYEAAQVDGAGRWAKFFHITLPGIRPVMIFLILAGMIGGFQLFELPFVLFQGMGPGYAGLTVVMYLFNVGFQVGNLAYASAIGWALVAIVLLAATIQLRMMRGTGES